LIYLYNLHGIIEQEIQKAYDGQKDIGAIIDEITGSVQNFCDLHGEKNILGLCIGLPGLYIRRESMHIAIVTGFEQLSKIDVQTRFQERFPFPVITEHDAKLSAFAEWKNNSLQPGGVDKILVGIQTIGVGAGAGIVFNGKIVSGSLGIAGEIGHMGINFHEVYSHMGRGEYEQYASTETTRQYLKERLFEFPNTVLTSESGYPEIKKAYLEGDELAVAIMKKLAWMVGYGIANIIFVLNPDTIIIGPEYPSDDNFLYEIKESVKHRVPAEIFEVISIRFSDISQDTTLLGGYHLTLETLLNNQQLYNRIKQVVCSS
jgi:predicted NBD/HSP70 family sugar kinase